MNTYKKGLMAELCVHSICVYFSFHHTDGLFIKTCWLCEKFTRSCGLLCFERCYNARSQINDSTAPQLQVVMSSTNLTTDMQNSPQTPRTPETQQPTTHELSITK